MDFWIRFAMTQVDLPSESGVVGDETVDKGRNRERTSAPDDPRTVQG